MTGFEAIIKLCHSYQLYHRFIMKCSDSATTNTLKRLISLTSLSSDSKLTNSSTKPAYWQIIQVDAAPHYV